MATRHARAPPSTLVMRRCRSGVVAAGSIATGAASTVEGREARHRHRPRPTSGAVCVQLEHQQRVDEQEVGGDDGGVHAAGEQEAHQAGQHGGDHLHDTGSRDAGDRDAGAVHKQLVEQVPRLTPVAQRVVSAALQPLHLRRRQVGAQQQERLRDLHGYLQRQLGCTLHILERYDHAPSAVVRAPATAALTVVGLRRACRPRPACRDGDARGVVPVKALKRHRHEQGIQVHVGDA